LFIFNVAGLLFVYFLFDFLIFWVKVFLWVWFEDLSFVWRCYENDDEGEKESGKKMKK
jgi:hypothetical protein